ncbi:MULTISPECIES: GIY-YIG nuclease family protein [unclassified Rathayibacter]|uniref:GIY-YIG nuclease family protein n=1 Tax=unclassified Rathayibacter TaxID=2609250 RepID=UPI0006F84D3A|nr:MULTISPECIES: GIY-YIG nuclease family protein [unclassified Rathayibacter]KQQ05708.1 ATPase [Rathayibacter sp. Leaf294]KQS13566.1 ATPase [Rathayibacter sp. Leaf185]
MSACAIDGCRAEADAGAPLDLCAAHLELAHDWVARESGVVDALPSPCLVCGSRLGVRLPSAWLCAACEWRFGEVPDGELAPPRIDVVYYIRFGERIKIGTSGNPRQRLHRLRHEELLAFERGGRALEQQRHAQFAAERLERTEWFARSPALDRHIETVAAGEPDPWALHRRWWSEALALRT